MLKASIGVGVAVSKLISVVLSVEAKSKWHDIVLPVVWAAIVINIFRGYSLPKKQKQHIFTLTYIYIDIRNLDKRAMVRFKFVEPMKLNSLSSSGAGEQIPEPAFRSSPAASLHARGPCRAPGGLGALSRCPSWQNHHRRGEHHTTGETNSREARRMRRQLSRPLLRYQAGAIAYRYTGFSQTSGWSVDTSFDMGLIHQHRDVA